MRKVFCGCRCIKKKKKNFKTSQEIFEAGKKRIMNYLDVVRLSKHQCQMQIFFDTILNDKQKLLMKFQKKQLINELADEKKERKDRAETIGKKFLSKND